MSTPGQLQPALHNAWGLNRHSVVEVVTDRRSNVGIHRSVQASVLRTVQAAYALATRQAGVPAAELVPAGVAAQGLDAVPPPPRVAGWHVSRYNLPLARPLTTATGPAAAREGLLLQVSLQGPDGSMHHGIGEAAPLPGLHAESLGEAEAQLRLLGRLVQGVPLPVAFALLGDGHVDRWLSQQLGVPPAQLLPSVRCALECALLTALASSHGVPLTQLLAGPSAAQPDGGWAGVEVSVNGLLPGEGAPEALAAEAARVVREGGYTALKLKVGRLPSPLDDAAVACAVRAAVGPGVALHADANRAWSFEQAVAFGRAAAGAGLAYVEEPTQDPGEMAAFYLETGGRRRRVGGGVRAKALCFWLGLQQWLN